jgi:hypothetical protein
MSLSEAFLAYDGPGTLTLLMVPDGSGPSFSEARNEAGEAVDATITMYLRDPWGMAIVNFPREDIWIETEDDGLAFCLWGLHPDDHTDWDGMTRWVQPALAGGSSEGPAIVMVNGAPLTSNDGLPLRFNSPDLNGDGIVNLTDAGMLSSDYYTGYTFRSDFHRDGLLNLADIAPFARAYGAQCP